MQVEFEPESETSIKATVTVPAERCDEAYHQVIAAVSYTHLTLPTILLV